MKNIYVILIGIVAGACLAIGGIMLVNHLGENSNGDRALATEQSAHPLEAIDLPPYKSPDLQMEMARGNVRSIEFKNTDGALIVYNYTHDGMNEEELEGVFERNELGQIVSYYDSDSYTYNKDGFISETKRWVETCYMVSKYEYNEYNELVKEVEKIFNEGMYDDELAHEAVYVYSNYKYDDCGNWISRSVKVERKKKHVDYDIPVDVHSPKYDTDVFRTEKRKITYYE
ncbi:MAG: hypothetical protein IKY49_04090 [Paludibacteraceae bacterium]|nr:hypothetical protein [Paludibacteraceae bacterium]